MNVSGPLRILCRINIVGWLLMATTVAVAWGSVSAMFSFGGKRAGGALAAAEATVLADRVRKALAMRRVKTGRRV